MRPVTKAFILAALVGLTPLVTGGDMDETLVPFFGGMIVGLLLAQDRRVKRG